MSRPRKPYGNPPGRLPATMVKVLAAELSDQGRLSRGKRYWADDAVVDIVVGHGAVTAEVQGGRPDAYVVTIEAGPGDGVPSKRDIWIQCTCPDDSGFGNEACKHAVAALFALSDEIAIEPALLERWRASRRSPRRDPIVETDDDDDRDDDDDGELPSNVIPLRRGAASPMPARAPAPAREPVRDPQLDEIARLLAAPTGSALPELPSPDPLAHPPSADPLLDGVLHDALDHLMIQWD